LTQSDGLFSDEAFVQEAQTKKSETNEMNREENKEAMMANEYYTGALKDDAYYSDKSVENMSHRIEALIPYSDKEHFGETLKGKTLDDHWADDATHWDTFAPNHNPMNWGVSLDCPPYAPDCNGDGGSKGSGTAFNSEAEEVDEVTGTTSSQLKAGKLASNSGVVNVGIEGKPVQYSAFISNLLPAEGAGASEGEMQLGATTLEQHNNDALIVPLGGVFLAVGFLFMMVMVVFKKRQQQHKRPTTLLPSSTPTQDDGTNMVSL